MRRRSRRPDRGGHDRWLVSYADLVTLLLAFFTVMYAASNVDATKLAPLSSSLQDAFNTAAPALAGASGRPTIVPPIEVVPRLDAVDELRRLLDAELAEAIADRKVEVTEDRRGLVVSLPEEAAFPVASDDVSPAALELIGRVAAIARQLPNEIRIEGHTDDVPIRTARFRSNWELSTARASAVVAYLIEGVGFEPARLSAAGYGEFHPRVANDSPANRALNRRIDIVVIDPAR
jgi:chemotaxis protein MotB